jgi:hypothetical protein
VRTFDEREKSDKIEQSTGKEEQMAKTTDRSQYYADWYEQNRAKRNKARRKRYQTDKSFRQAQLEQSRDYKRRNPTPARGSVRVVEGEEVPVYRIGALADAVGRTILTIRNWERDGLIPQPTASETNHRVYLSHQALLVKRFSDFMTENQYTVRSDPEVQKKQASLINFIKKHW